MSSLRPLFLFTNPSEYLFSPTFKIHSESKRFFLTTSTLTSPCSTPRHQHLSSEPKPSLPTVLQFSTLASKPYSQHRAKLIIFKFKRIGTSQMVLLIRLHIFTERSAGSIPGQGTKIPQAICHDQNKIK